MHLSTLDHAVSFDLHIVGYQFPAEHLAAYDSNWLNIRIDVAHPLGHWSFTDSALLTYEVAQLAEWFEGLASGDRSALEESFLEPNLGFLMTAERGVEYLHVRLRLEFAPPWFGRARREDEDPPIVSFPLKDIDLTACAASLREELQKFPQRADR